MQNKKKATLMILLTITLCLLETLMELVIEPTYFIKSLIKIILFLIVPLLVFKLLNLKIFDESYKIEKKINKTSRIRNIYIYSNDDYILNSKSYI